MVGCFPDPTRLFQARVGSERQPLFLGNLLLFWFFSDSWKSVFFSLFFKHTFFKTCLFNSKWEGLVQLWQFVQLYEGSGVDFSFVGTFERIWRRRLLASTSVTTLGLGGFPSPLIWWLIS